MGEPIRTRWPRARMQLVWVALIVALFASVMPLGAPRAVAVVTSYFAEDLSAIRTSADAQFTGLPHAAANTAVVNVNPGLTMYFRAPDGAPLTPGTYPDATYQITAGKPWLNTGQGMTGSFTIHAATFDAGVVTSLAVDFVLDNDGHEIHGVLRFNSTWPVSAFTGTPDSALPNNPTTTKPITYTTTITAVGTGPTTLSGLAFTGPGAPWWSVVSTTCIGATLDPGETCTATIRVTPTTYGNRYAWLEVRWGEGAGAWAVMSLYTEAQIGSSISVSTSQPVIGGQGFSAKATVPAIPFGGQVSFMIDGGVVASSSVSPNQTTVEAWVPSITAGWHTLTAEYTPISTPYVAGSTSSPLAFVAKHETSTTMTVSKQDLLLGETATINVSVTGPASMTGGTLRLRDLYTNTTLKTLTVSTTARSFSLTTTLAPAGQHILYADYIGSPYYAESTAQKTVNVSADTSVALLSSSVGPATFYPYVDQYLDAAAIGGSLGESATVEIRIYPVDSLLTDARADRYLGAAPVAKVNLGSKSGTYTYQWNGQNASGALLPEGRYRVDQHLVDAAGNRRLATGYVTLSHKRMYTSTVTITKTLAQAKYATQAARGWEFVLPAATVYNSIRFEADARSDLVPGIQMGAWDYRQCLVTAQWSPGCVASWSIIGQERKWWGRSLSTVNERSGTTVRAFLNATGSGYVWGVRLKVTYGVLK